MTDEELQREINLVARWRHLGKAIDKIFQFRVPVRVKWELILLLDNRSKTGYEEGWFDARNEMRTRLVASGVLIVLLAISLGIIWAAWLLGW